MSYITLKSWTPVAIWGYNAPIDSCTICKNKLTEKCPECLTTLHFQTKNCIITQGKCTHAFHHHCLDSWRRQGANSCPTCSIPWISECDNMDKTAASKTKV